MKYRRGRGRRRPSAVRGVKPLESAFDVCGDCDVMLEALEVFKAGGKLDLDGLRDDCAACEGDMIGGIYKFDVMLTAYLHRRQVKGRGRQPTIGKRYGKAIDNLKSEGKSIRGIAKTIGISPDSVQNYLKSKNESDMEKQ